MPSLNFRTPIHELSRVGKTTASRLKKLQINSAGDLLKHLPFRYDDLSNISTIADAPVNEVITILATVELLQNRRSFRKRMMITEGIISDQSGSLKVIWFNQPFLAKTLKIGGEYYLSGKIEEDKYGRHLKNPSYEIQKEIQTHTARIVPIYRSTNGITQKQIRFLIRMVLPLANQSTDWIPESIAQNLSLMELKEAWSQIHFPSSDSRLQKAIWRLKFGELFLIQLYNLKTRQELEKYKAPKITFQKEKMQSFVRELPFELTNDQKKSAWQIIRDMEKDKPMNRLLEGEVGSGKTVVSALAMYGAAVNGYQSVLMAPTEILAFQHFETIRKLLAPKQIQVGLLTSSYCETAEQKREETANAKHRKKMSQDIRSGKIQVCIGTHSVIQEEIRFENLGLAIIDEQHRFGVKQRQLLKTASSDQNIWPHFLSMTATPIPRSLALAFYGDLELSQIKELPKRRSPISTHLVTCEKQEKAYAFIREELKLRRQAFVICPLIEPSDILGVKSVKEEYETLRKNIFPDFKLAMLHGKMKSSEKETIMKDFKDKKTDILVSTSVIEVGVDIPNATMIIIEAPERFGLAQLHQFRGRVGRGSDKSHCFLFLKDENPHAYKRLALLARFNDGFSLAEQDFKLRGPGNIYGTEQSGFMQLKIATWHDHDILEEAKKQAKIILKQDSSLREWPRLQKKLEKFGESIHLE